MQSAEVKLDACDDDPPCQRILFAFVSESANKNKPVVFRRSGVPCLFLNIQTLHAHALRFAREKKPNLNFIYCRKYTFKHDVL